MFWEKELCAMNAYALRVETLEPVRAPETLEHGELVLFVVTETRKVEIIEVEAFEVRKAA